MHRVLVCRSASLAPQSAGVKEVLQRIAKLVPVEGMSGPQFRALVEDECPQFAERVLQAGTLQSLLRAHADILTVDTGGTDWTVRPTAKPTTMIAAASPADYQRVLRHCASHFQHRSQFQPLEEVCLLCGASDARVLESILADERRLLDVKLQVTLRPKRSPRSALVFVDGDHLSSVAVDELCTALHLIKEDCTMHILRRPTNVPVSSHDVVTAGSIPTAMCIEKKAREVRYRTPVILKDIVYMCSARKFDLYAHHVAPSNPFPDSDVYVCCPSKIQLVCEKKVIELI